MTERLTDRMIKALPLPEKGYRIVYDGDVKGFGVRLTAAGARAFTVEYRLSGAVRRVTIGSFPDWSAAAARERAREIKREADLGRDHNAERQAERMAPTVRDLWVRYEADHLPAKAPRAALDDRLMFRDYILPAFGTTKVGDLTPADIDALHRSVSEHGRVRANRVLEVLRKALALAIRWGWRTDNPASGVRRNPEQPRHRYLTEDELKRLGEALNHSRSQGSADAIRLLLLTGARRGEVLGATWDQFDLAAGVWIKPSAHTKQRRLHRVPLSTAAVELLRHRRGQTSGTFVFPGAEPDHPLTDLKSAWRVVCRRAGLEDVRIHDLRHTYASVLASHGISLPTIGALLGHTQAQTTHRYAHLFDDPLRVATERVATVLIRGQ
jgi:integrase